VAAFMLVPAVFALTGCGKNPPSTPETPHEHLIINHYEEDNGFVYTWSTCKGCNDYSTERVGFTIPNLRVVSTMEEAYNEVNDMTSSKTILFKAGTYEGGIDFMQPAFEPLNISILAEDGVYVERIYISTHVVTPFESLRVENVNFVGEEETATGLGSNDIDINNVTVKNCTFSGNARLGLCNNTITNLVVDSCDFKNIDNADHTLTAIFLQNVDGIEVKNCTFDDVIYNAMQIDITAGDIKITNNSFKNIHSRTIYFIGDMTGVESCDISGNTFYAKDLTDANAKGDGNYFRSNNANDLLVVGENYWKNIPDNETLYFKNFTYDKAAQKKA
jgi:hypothetical protein